MILHLTLINDYSPASWPSQIGQEWFDFCGEHCRLAPGDDTEEYEWQGICSRERLDCPEAENGPNKPPNALQVPLEYIRGYDDDHRIIRFGWSGSFDSFVPLFDGKLTFGHYSWYLHTVVISWFGGNVVVDNIRRANIWLEDFSSGRGTGRHCWGMMKHLSLEIIRSILLSRWGAIWTILEWIGPRNK